MKLPSVAQAFTDWRPLVGPVFWMLSAQYFVVQVVVARAWTTSYNWRLNTISDLGNTNCGAYGARFVCSPWHGFMNASLIVLGVTMALGSLLIYQGFKNSRGSLGGFSCMAAAGIGTLLVGLFPENGTPSLHDLGAALPFLVGNVGLVMLSLSLPVSRSLRIYSFLSGALALTALALFMSHSYMGLGEGGLERIVAYPQTFWLIVFGIYAYGNHARKRYNKAIK